MCATRLPAPLQALQRTSVSRVLVSSIQLLNAVTWNPGWTSLETTPSPLSQSERDAVRIVVGGVASSTFAEAQQMRTFESRSGPYTFIAAIYRPLIPFLTVLAVPGFLVGLRGRGTQVSLAVLLGALVLGVFIRVVLIAIIDTTDFSADGRYLLPARQFLLAFGIVGALYVIEDWAYMFRHRTSPHGERPI